MSRDEVNIVRYINNWFTNLGEFSSFERKYQVG